MDNDQIIQEATEAVEKGLPCAFLVPPLLDVCKSQKAEINILTRKKEALRDEVAEQQAEIERLREQIKKGDKIYEEAMLNTEAEKDNLKQVIVRLRKAIKVQDIMIEQQDYKLQRAKSEAYMEFAENVKKISKEVTVPYVADTSIQEHKTGMFWYKTEDFDNALNKLLSNDMGRYDHYTDSFVKEPTESNE